MGVELLLISNQKKRRKHKIATPIYKNNVYKSDKTIMRKEYHYYN